MDFLRKIHRKLLETAQTVVKSGTAYFLPRGIIFLHLCRNDCNLINGVYSCENLWLLTDVLRKEWGFDGFVVTDWGAMNERVAALKAGLELEMPSSRGTACSGSPGWDAGRGGAGQCGGSSHIRNYRVDSALEAVKTVADVTNVGSRVGAEVIQLYVGFDGRDTVGRPVRELRGFEKIMLSPGETKTVTVQVSAEPLPLPCEARRTLGDLLDLAKTEEQLRQVLHLGGALGENLESLSGDTDATEMIRALIDAMPLHSVKSFSRATDEDIQKVVDNLARR